VFLVPCAPFATLPTWPRIMQMTLAEHGVRVQRKVRHTGAGFSSQKCIKHLQAASLDRNLQNAAGSRVITDAGRRVTTALRLVVTRLLTVPRARYPCLRLRNLRKSRGW
jgi:hypothetical protein